MQHMSYVTMSPAYDFIAQVYQPTIDTCFINMAKSNTIQYHRILFIPFLPNILNIVYHEESRCGLVELKLILKPDCGDINI